MSDPRSFKPNLRPQRDGWEWIPLGAYVENHDGRRIPISRKERESRPGLFPYYGASGVIDTIDGYTHDGEFVLVGEDGANLLSRSKPLAFLTRGKVWVNNHAHVLKCKPSYSNAYLAYYINSIDLSQYVTGTAQPKLSQSMMNRIRVPVAPPDQQREIVAEIEKQFSRLDEAVANLKRVKANLKRYKAAVLKAAVEGRLVPAEAELARREGRSFETGAQLLQRILDTRRSQWKGKGKYKEPSAPETAELPEVPEGWIWSSVDQLSDSALIGLDRGRDQQNANGVGVPYVKMTNVSLDGLVDFSELVFVEADALECQRYELRDGDLLFNTRNSKELVGKTGLVRKPSKGAIYNNNLMRIRIVDGATSHFVIAQMCSAGFRRRLEFVKKATTNVAAVYAKDLFLLQLALPPTSEQHRIVAEVDRCLSLIRTVETEVDANLKRAQILRQSVLAAAFLT